MNKKLRSLIDRAERLIAEREEANEGLRDLRKECKSDGYEPAQILRLAQLSHDDKKRAKLAAANEVLSLYNRESGLGLDLGLDEIPEPDRAAVTSAPAGGGGKGVAQAMPPRPEPIPQSEAGASTRKDDDEAGGARSRDAGHKALSPASDTVAEQVRAARAWSPDPQPFDPNAKCDHAYVQGNGTGKFACVFCGEITFDRATLGPVPPRSDYESPAGAQLPPTRAADCDPAPDAPPHRAAGPAGETDLTIPPHLRRGTAANARARGL